jgi:hypothetical protein
MFLLRSVDLLKPNPQTDKAMSADSFRQFTTDFGVPRKLIVDVVIEQVGIHTAFMTRVSTYHIDHT